MQHRMKQRGDGACDACIDVRQPFRFKQADEQAEAFVDLVDDEAVEGDAVVEQPASEPSKLRRRRYRY